MKERNIEIIKRKIERLIRKVIELNYFGKIDIEETRNVLYKLHMLVEWNLEKESQDFLDNTESELDKMFSKYNIEFIMY